MMLHTVLGSCVAVCLYDPVLRLGGMNHILVPSAASDGCREARGGVQAMELLINKLMKLGGDRRRFAAKAFGGANVIPGFSSPTIGERNTEFVRQFLSTEKIPLLAERMGGSDAIKLRFATDTSRATVSIVGKSVLSALVRDEDHYFHTGFADRFHIEEPTIF
jgi:chemotaxis receptor (MCP) glutamine deamidase CheD